VTQQCVLRQFIPNNDDDNRLARFFILNGKKGKDCKTMERQRGSEC